MNKIAVVINPIAGGGRGKKLWRVLQPGLNAVFEETSYRMSNRVDDLESITHALLKEKPDYLLIVGGDGTLNHVLNGIINNDLLLCPDTKIAYFNAGSGGDFARQFKPQKITEFLDRLIHNQTITTNIGKITLANHDHRYFLNIASCGLSGAVVAASAKSGWLKKLGGALNYLIHSFTTLMIYNKTQVSVKIDDNPEFDSAMLLMAVCNGAYFGGRMHVAPMAKIDDDLLDVVLFHDFSKLNAMFKLRKIYSGNHLLEKNVHYVQAKRVTIKSLKNDQIAIEADGEPMGFLPARFELLSTNLELIV